MRHYIKEEEKETEGKKRKKKSHRNYRKNYMYKIDNIYQKAKIKNLEQSLEFQKYNVKEKRKKKKTKTKTKQNTVKKL